MSLMTLRSRPWWPASLLLGVTIIACQATPTPPGPAQPTDGAAASLGASAPVDTSEPTIATEVIVGAGDFDLPEPAVGLGDLKSYRAKLSHAFQGTADGQPSQWTITTTKVSSTDPLASLYSVEAPAELELLDPTWAAERDDAAYRRLANGACIASLPGASLALPREPAAELSGLIGGEAAGEETVNGIASDVFTIDGGALGLSGDTHATGRVWIARAGGYVVRYEVTTDGGAAYFGEGISGTLTTRYELTDVNATVSIDLPADCPPGLIDAPMPTDARVIESLPGFLRFTTAMSVDKAAALYRDTSLAFAWRANRTAAISKTFAALSFDRAGVVIDVLVTKGQSGTEVEIVAHRK
jgi:hypothetical protein